MSKTNSSQTILITKIWRLLFGSRWINRDHSRADYWEISSVAWRKNEKARIKKAQFSKWLAQNFIFYWRYEGKSTIEYIQRRETLEIPLKVWKLFRGTDWTSLKVLPKRFEKVVKAAQKKARAKRGWLQSNLLKM